MASPTLRWVRADGGNRAYALRPGVNTIGRQEGNSVVIDHPSVSSRHCELVWEGEAALVRDLGSTNGTFINNQPIQEAVLLAGQVLRLGTVELALPSEVAASVSATGEPGPSPGPPPLARPLSSRPAPQASAAPGSFLRSLPGALAYPLSKNGIVLLVAGTVVFGFLSFLGRFSFIVSGIMFVFSTGYLFAYVQKIVSASAQGEPDMPDYPEFSEWWSDIVQPFFLLVWTLLFCFGPGLALYAAGNREDPILRAGAMSLVGLGGLYFPMALLAVAVTDSFVALNPVVVIPSIFRVFGHYLVVCLVLAFLFALSLAGEQLIEAARLPVVSFLVSGFVSLYFLAVEMRILGLLYYWNHQRLGWFS